MKEGLGATSTSITTEGHYITAENQTGDHFLTKSRNKNTYIYVCVCQMNMRNSKLKQLYCSPVATYCHWEYGQMENLYPYRNKL